MKSKSKIGLFRLLIIGPLLSCVPVMAQTTPTPKQTSSSPVIVERRPTAPQVVTVLHRLNGLKLLRLLLRSDQKVAVARLDEAFNMTGEVHTNIIAGLALDDGQIIAALLPEAEVELGGPAAPTPPMPAQRAPSALGPATGAPLAMQGWTSTLTTAPDLTVIERDGRRYVACYIGLDGITGLSLLRLTGRNPAQTRGAENEEITVGQRMRLFAPEPVSPAEPGASNTIYVRVGETLSRVVNITRGQSGEVTRVRIKAPNFSPSNIGGIAVNDAGQTVGIVDGVNNGEATLLPAAAIRGAAKRVLARESSVLRPWLGVQGELVAAAPLEKIVRNGWTPERAMTLVEDRRGILLTSVAAGSPAALAELHPGDVILQVNEGEVKTADDFSLFLSEAGSGSPVRFTVVRPGRVDPEAVMVKLGESIDPFGALKMIGRAYARAAPADPLLGQGVETIRLRPKAAAQFGANGGLLVVYVEPSSAAFKAGLKPGDVIEAIDGRQISTTSRSLNLPDLAGASYTLNVVRNRQKLVLMVVTSSK